MKNIRRIIMSAVFMMLGTAAVFADIIDPSQPRDNPTPPVEEAAAQGGKIIIIMLIVAAAIVVLVALITKRGSSAKAPAAPAAPAAVKAAAAVGSAATVGAVAAAKLDDSELNEELHEENLADAEIMQTDTENSQLGPESMGLAAEENAVDTGSAGLGGEVGGDLG